MTELATREAAASRAAHIRAGIGAYLTTLAHISTAYAQRDWVALGYESWDAYVNGEYSEHRLKLSPEHRQKAVAELRLAGMSTRAIGSALGVAKGTVDNDLVRLANSGQSVAPERVASLDGRDRPATQPDRPISLGQSPTQVPTTVPSATVSAPAELPGQQDLADAFLSVVDDLSAIDEPAATAIADETDRRLAARAAVDAAMDRFLPPDPDAAHRTWRINFLSAIQPALRLMGGFTVDAVAEHADDECLDELRRLAQEVGTYYERVRLARPVPDNVRHLRAVS